MKTPAKTILIVGTGFALMLLGYFQGYLHGAVGALSTRLHDLLHEGKGANVLDMKTVMEMANKIIGTIEVTVDSKPFGMHVKRGGTMVGEVFPGFPAEKNRIRPGCSLVKVGSQQIDAGTWLEAFEKATIPFNITLVCPPALLRGQGPINSDSHNYRVLVVKKPFGMNIQVNVLPRVIEVLPGYPAEAAGVKRGFVLKAVNDQPVDAKNWFDIWQKVEVPCTLTFDKNVPLHKDNPFFNQTDGTWKPLRSPDTGSPSTAVADPKALPSDYSEDDGFNYYSCTVNSQPFGMQVSSVPGSLPIIIDVVKGMPADKEGIKVGDILVKVAGRRIDASSWFSAFQQAAPPFGLRLKRPINVTSEVVAEVLKEAVAKEPLTVLVDQRPFGMHVRRGSNVVQEVFPNFGAQKKGIRAGCQVMEVAGVRVSQGSWMEAFQQALLPFELKLLCPTTSTKPKGALAGKGAVSTDKHRYQVVVQQRPYGMNVQVNVVPRVVEVLPGSPAEGGGVKPGFVLLEINDVPVNGSNWFDVWQKSPVPSTLTFDTSMPLHKNNPYLKAAADGEPGHVEPVTGPPKELPKDLPAEVKNALDAVVKDDDSNQNFEKDFRCKVSELPFGMQVSAPSRTHPIVHRVTEGLPAEREGVRPGDILVEVAGLPVDAESWFSAFQQATPPFGLRFRRPKSLNASNAAPPPAPDIRS